MRRPWLDAGLPVADRVGALLEAMTLEERVAQLHQVANPDPVDDAEALRAGAFGTCIVASGAFAGTVRDAGTQAATVNALQRVAVEGSRLGVPLLVLAGTWFPVSLLPKFLLQIAWFDPVFHMNEAMKGVSGRGLGWTDLSGSLMFLAVFAAVSLALGVASYRRMLIEEKRS